MKEKGLGLQWNQIVGVPGEETKAWSQVRFEVRQKGEKRVGLIVMLSLELEEEMKDKGRAMMEAIVLSFDQMKEVGMDFVLRETALMKEELRGIGEGLVGLVIASEDGKRSLYIGGEGGLRAELIRNGQEKEIWRGGQPVSGWIVSSDKIVMGTREFFEKIWSKEEEVSELRTKVGKLSDSGKVVGLMMNIGEVEELEEVVVADILEEKSEEVEPGLGIENKEDNQGRLRKNLMMERVDKWVGKLKRQLGMGRGLTLKSDSMEKRSWGLILGTIFLFVLVGSVVVGARKQAVNREREEFLAVVEPIEYTLTEASEIKGINGVRARSLVLEARGKVSSQGDRFEEGGNADEWSELVRKVESAWKEMSGEVIVVGEKWLDIGVVKEGIKVDLINIDERMLVWGKESRVVVEVDLSDKSGEVIAGGEIMGGVIGMTGIREGIALLTEEEVRMVDENGEELENLDLEGVRGKVVKGFGRNVYVLAQEDFFRFAATENGWGKRTRFLQAGREIDTERAVDVSIDGEVFVLMNDGEVVKLSQGEIIEFKLMPVEEWREPKRIVSSEELNRIWVWDKKLGVVEFERETGNYLRKLVWSEFERMNDVSVDTENKRLMGVIGSEVWVVGL